jgi:TIR domain
MTAEMSPRVFISYAWEDDAYRHWIRRLAATLERDGILVRLDQLHHEATRPFPEFMNSEVRNADVVVVVGSPEYRRKVHLTEDGCSPSGVGWESALIASHLFQGNQQKVVAALGRGTRAESLPDYLVTFRAFDLSDPDDPRGYEELLAYLRTRRRQHSGATDDLNREPSVQPLWSRHSSFRYVSTFRDFVDSRWPATDQRAIFPSWIEFATGRVQVPEELWKRLGKCLSRDRACLISGAVGTGKTVAAAAIAYEWTRVAGHYAYWLDVADVQPSFDSEIRREVASIAMDGGGNLLVLDNASSSPKFARWVVSEFQRLDAPKHRLLILTRPVAIRPGLTEGTFVDLLDSQRIDLEPTPELLRCTAERLFGRRGVNRLGWVHDEYRAWHVQFGGDVIAFAHAAINTHGNQRPDVRAAHAYIRSTYVDRFRSTDQGLRVISRIAAATMLDLEVDDAGLGQRGPQIAAALLEDGSVQAIERFGFRRRTFRHAGLAHLIAAVLARDAGLVLEDFCAETLADAALDNPRLLGPILNRIDQPDVSGLSTDRLFRRLVGDKSVDQFLVADPVGALKAHRRRPYIVPWEKTNHDPDLHASVLRSLARCSLQEIASFLRDASRDHAIDPDRWLEALLSLNGFPDLLVKRLPNELAAFLELVDRLQPTRCDEILARALMSDGAGLSVR